jgi:CRP-like cAMP-binding protein
MSLICAIRRGMSAMFTEKTSLPFVTGRRFPYHTREPAHGSAMSGEVTHSLVKVLKSVPDFAGLGEHALLHIVGASVNLAFPAGSVVFEEGTPGDSLCVVLSGEVRIFARQDGREVEVSRVGTGESFGELSLLLGRTHSKTAQAVEDTELLVIPRESFRELLATNEELAAMFRRRLEERQTLEGQVSGTGEGTAT